MLNLLIETNDGGWIERNVRDVMTALEELQKETPFGNFSELGVVEPFLLLCLLKKAVYNDESGDKAVERIRFELEKNDSDLTAPDEEKSDEGPGDSLSFGGQQKEYLEKQAEEAGKRGVLRLHIEDIEKVLGPLSRHFHTSLYVFDRIACDNVTEYKTRISLKALDLEEKGAEIFATAIRLSYSTIFGEEKAINPALATLARGLLSIREGERFADFMCGTCLSTAVIAGQDKDAELYLSDIDTRCTDYAEIYSRLSGMKCVIRSLDAFDEKTFSGPELVDKVFVNPAPEERLMNGPIEFDGVLLKEVAAAAVMKAANILTPGGKAVMVIPSRYLYSTRPDYANLRKYLLKRRIISTVILLPCLSRGSAGPTALLVLRNMPNEDILMVDWTDREKDDTYFYYEKKYMKPVLRNSARRRLRDIVNRRIEGDGSSLVRQRDIEYQDFNLLPSLYIRPVEKPAKRDLGEIDREISSVLDDIQDVIGKLKDN